MEITAGPDDRDVVETSVTTALASSFSVPESQVTVIVGAYSAGSGRRLTTGSWPVTFEVRVAADAAAPSEADVQAKLDEQCDSSTLSNSCVALTIKANSFSTGSAASPAPPVRSVAVGTPEGNVTATEADSSATVLIVGIVGFVAVLVALLIPTLFRRRCMALLGLKRGNNNAPRAASGESAKDGAHSHDWDCDDRAGRGLVDKKGVAKPQDVELEML